MTIPLPVILNALSGCPISTSLPDLNSLYFSWAVFLPSDGSALRGDRLYLCTLDDARDAAERSEAGCFLCPAEHRGGEPLPPRTLAVESAEPLCALAARVQERIAETRDWLAQLNESAMENPSYQGLLDYCEPVLKNPLYILDASYKLLAYTKNTLDDDEIDVRLRETGYHSEEAMLAFRRSNRFKVYQSSVGVLVNPPGNPNKYATVSKWLWDRGMPVVHLIMVCSNAAPDENLLALFELAAQNCALRFRQLQSAAPHTGHYYDPLLNDLLFGNLDNPRIIAERARMSGLPPTGSFDCFKILLREGDSYPVARLLDELLSLFPAMSAISHGYEIVALGQRRGAQEEALPQGLREFLEKYGAVCGVSEPFRELADLPAAYTQASRALGIGEALRRHESTWNADVSAPGATHAPRSGSVFFYDDVVVYYALSQARNGNVDVFRLTPYLELARELLRSDREHRTDNAQMLYVYLASERRATRTGELLHMHRNNVLYRIPRIAEKLGVDLDDYWVRLNLLLAFHLLELEEAHREQLGEA